MDQDASISTEEVVEALLDFLVEPLLPLNPQLTQPPSLLHQESIAKQMHSVVLLYNYYHRKLQPESEFLPLNSFCKLVVVLKPGLMAYMKLMHLENYSEVDYFENQLSVTEKAIMDACDISIALDALRNIPDTMEWPITKVSVFLIDSRMENCFLLDSSVTNGIWSVIEKDIDASKMTPGSRSGGNASHKRKRTTVEHLTELTLQELAMLAVKEVAGIDQTDVKVLESYAVYSLTDEKAAAQFFVMQSSQSWDECIQVPIKDAITSLQGPLVKMGSNGWMITSVVKYFHLLPYSGILSDCITRGFGLVGSLHSVDISTEERNNNRHQPTCLANQVNRSHLSEVSASLVDGFQSKCTAQSFDNVLNIHNKPVNVSSTESNIVLSTAGINAKGGCQEEEFLPLPSQSKPQNLENVLDAFTSKENASTEMELSTLLRKREELFQQMHNVEKEIALCNETIRSILDGCEDGLGFKIDTILEACLDKALRKEVGPDRELVEDRGSSRRLSEAVLPVKNPCQELDDICQKNVWILPTYSVYLSDGGFHSYVTVKGLDFELSCGGEVRSSPKEARMSACVNMITHLQNLVSQRK